jgi:O-succinylbenzoate synthase
VNEYPLRIGDRMVTLLEGPAGWGEWSPFDGYPCDPATARRAAEEAANAPWPEPVRDVVAVNALVTNVVRADALRGFPCVKIKVQQRSDIGRVATVREVVGPGVAIRVDANGVWDVETAVDMIERMRPYDLELVEQPVAALDDLARVRAKVDVPIAADECIRNLDDARELARLDAADAIVVKVQPLGGIRATLDIIDAAGVPIIVTSMYETSIGLAVGLALAAALPELPYACGLATLDQLEGDVVIEPLRPEAGLLRVRRPIPDPALLARYAVTS